jgi:hypothetical protein
MFQKVFLRLTRARRFRSRMIALCAIGAIMLVAVGSPPLLANPDPVTVRMDPATRAAPVNGTFTVDIMADVSPDMDTNGLGAYEFDLVYDSDYLKVISVSDAEELGKTGRTVNELGPTDVAEGQTLFAAYSYPPDGVSELVGPKNTVVLARVTLWAKRATSVTTLNVENALLTDTQANSWAGAQLNVQLGTIPIPMVVSADYDNDAETDIAIWRPGNGHWYIRNSQDGTITDQQWGASTDVLVPADFDGDGKTDIAVYRPSNGYWYILNSQSGTITSQQWGASTDVLVPADYDGDGKTDIAVYRPSNGYWYILNSQSGTITSQQWGASTDVLVPADFDGDGETDIAVYRPSNGYWYILNSQSGTITDQQWGADRDIPLNE